MQEFNLTYTEKTTGVMFTARRLADSTFIVRKPDGSTFKLSTWELRKRFKTSKGNVGQAYRKHFLTGPRQ